MEISEIKDFLESNKDSDEVKSFMNSLTPSIDQIMERPDFQKAVKSLSDKEARRQVEAYKTNTFDTTVEEKVAKRMEAAQHKEPWEIKLQDMEKRNLELENKFKEKERAELIQKNKNFALKSLSDSKLPSDILDFIVSDDEETTTKNLETFQNMMEGYTTNIKNDFMSGNNTSIPGKTEVIGAGGLKVPGENATDAEYDAYVMAARKQ